MFNNAGTFTKQGTGYAQFYNNGNNLVFNNTGTVDVQAGDLWLVAGGTHTGDFSLAAGSTLWLNGTHSFAATSDVSGAGTVNVYGGTTNFNGQLSASNNLLVSGGTVNFNSATIAGTIHVAGGTANFNNTTIVDELTMSSGMLSGAGNVTFTGASTWTGGTMSGAGQTTIGSGGTLSMVVPGTTSTAAAPGEQGHHDLDRRRLGDDGRHVPEQRQLHGQLRDASLDELRLSAVAAACSTTPARSPSWARAASGSKPRRQHRMAFNNTGTVDIQAGDCELEASGTHTGDFSIAAGSTLRLARHPQLRCHQPHHGRRHGQCLRRHDDLQRPAVLQHRLAHQRRDRQLRQHHHWEH